MKQVDARQVAAVMEAATGELFAQQGLSSPTQAHGHEGRLLEMLERFVETDGPGCWVAEDGGGIVGTSIGVQRGFFWALATLFVHPRVQAQGIGRKLLALAQRNGSKSDVGMIMSSVDFRAIRSYARMGFDLHPAVQVQGEVERSKLPATPKAREGDLSHLRLVDRVDRKLLPAARTAEVEFLLKQGARIAVSVERGNEGFVVFREGAGPVDGCPMLLGAVSEPTAQALLAYVLGETDGPAHAVTWTWQQSWAIELAFRVGLRVTPGGPLFLRGLPAPPGPWLPNGFYF